MQKKPAVSLFKKTFPALVAMIVMTVFLGLATLAFGLNALFNQNISPVQAAAQPAPQTTSDQATLQDLQAQIAQYQARETQYQNELQQAADQLNQANQQNQQYQQLIGALQNAGLIQITQDGRVFIMRGGFDGDNDR